MIDRRRVLSLVLAAVAALPLGFAAAPAAISGRITEVDVSARTLTVHDAKAGKVQLLVDESTVIVLDGDENAVLEDLFAGDEIVTGSVKELASGRLLLARATVTSRVPDDAADADDAEADGSGH